MISFGFVAPVEVPFFFFLDITKFRSRFSAKLFANADAGLAELPRTPGLACGPHPERQNDNRLEILINPRT